MKLDTAVERLEALKKSGVWVDPELDDQAVELGIQALRRIQAIRITDRVERITRLPGETGE